MIKKRKNYYKVPRINLKDYEDITSSIDDVFQSVRGTVMETTDDITKRDSNNILIRFEISFKEHYICI